MDRLQKVISAAGVTSRRKAEELIAAGRVTVNGAPAYLGQTVDPAHDRIEIDGLSVDRAGHATYLALNKPRGVVTSLRSTHGEQTVTSLVNVGTRVFPVGRLDKETSGLLLLTDDGEWANIVTHPRYRVDKQYILTLRGIIADADVERLRSGVRLPDGTVTSRARVEIIDRQRGQSRLSVTVIEGKKRQIRLMAEAVGHQTLGMERVRVGRVSLGRLPSGTWRLLNPDEVEGIRRYGHNANAPSGPLGPTSSSD